MKHTHVVGVSHRHCGELLSHALSLADSRGYDLDAVATLLTSAELAILLASENWLYNENRTATIERMRSKALESARDMFGRFESFEASQGAKSDRVGHPGKGALWPLSSAITKIRRWAVKP